jgi:hypothetical protein
MDRDALGVMPEARPLPQSQTSAAKGGSSFRALRSRPFRLYFGGQVASASSPRVALLVGSGACLAAAAMAAFVHTPSHLDEALTDLGR